MNHQVTPEAIHLCDDSVKLSDRITRLIEQYHSIVPPLCVERARLLTETYRQTESKPHALRRALALHRPDKNDVLDVLHKVGGLDIAAMTGAFLGCAHEGIAAAVDGYISVVAALCAVHLCPAAADYLFLSHQSYELGYAKAAQALGLTPCLALDMRLGEGSGCPLLFRVLEGACGVMANMATFAEAAIHDGYLDEIRAQDSFTVDRP